MNLSNTCSNCGEFGHNLRNCLGPVTSYGLITVRITPNEPINQATKLLYDTKSLTGNESQQVEFLLIQRKDSIGYVEIIRGKYKFDDIQYIEDQIAGMTLIERNRIEELPFDTLWTEMWASSVNGKFTSEYEASKKKFIHLKETGLFNKLIEKVKDSPVYLTPEWGFPKGRRNPREDNLECAKREFNEETGLRPNQYKIIENMEPIHETFVGNNHIHYAHIYYLAVCPENLEVKMKQNDTHMAREVGDIRWATLDIALQLIRPENVEKRSILLRASSILRNYCPLQMGVSENFFGEGGINYFNDRKNSKYTSKSYNPSSHNPSSHNPSSHNSSSHNASSHNPSSQISSEIISEIPSQMKPFYY